MSLKERIKSVLDGSFSVLLLGEEGTGKSKLLLDILREMENDGSRDRLEKNLQGRDELYRVLDCNQFSSWELNEVLVSCQVLIIDYLEYLPREGQVRLFNAISTLPGGASVETKQQLPQLVFICNRRLSLLYNDPNWFTPLLNRCRQQPFLFPALRTFSIEERFDAFVSVWDALLFDPIDVMLSKPFQKEVREYLATLELKGNYRDLETIAIQLMRKAKDPEFANTEPKAVVNDIHKAFVEIQNAASPYHAFRVDTPAHDMVKDFQKELVEWAANVYPSTDEMLKKLNISEKTAYNWKNKK